MLKLQSALVAEGNGFIGSALVQRLANRDVKVVCLVRTGSARTHIQNSPNVSVIEVPEYEPCILRTALRGLELDTAFNLASAGINPTECEPWDLLNGNMRVLIALLLGLNGQKAVRFIYTGNCSEYAALASGHKITEEDPMRSTSLCGAAKIGTHIYGRAVALEKGVPFATLHLFSVFGPGEASYRLVPHLIARLKVDQPVDLTPGEQVRDSLYVDDVVDALMLGALSEDLDDSGVYNVCSG